MAGVHDNLVSAEEVMRRVRLRLMDARSSVAAVAVSGSDGVTLVSRPVPLDTTAFEFKSEYVLADFVCHEDEELVHFAYRAILLREPDTQAEAYLHGLRNGDLSKVEILGQLRWSAEGMRHQVHIDGLLLPYTIHRWRKLPLVGGLIALVVSILRLPRLLAQKEQQIGRLAQRLQTVAGKTNFAIRDHTVRLSSLEHAFEHQPTDEMFLALRSEVEDVARLAHQAIEDFSSVQQSVSTLDRRIDQLGRSMRSSGSATDIAPVPGLDALYAEYERDFRGSPEEIKVRLEPYIKLVADLGLKESGLPALDLGCGRGEWLELLEVLGVRAEGVDLNDTFVTDCQEKRLSVRRADALEALQSLEACSVGLVSMMHLAEHLPFEDLLRIIDEAHRVLAPGGGFIIETPNPENGMVAQIGFYMDPTHRNPLPPQMLSWMVRARGFAQSDVLPLFHGRPQTGLPIVGSDVPAFDVINALATSTRASLDYAVIARKGVAMS